MAALGVSVVLMAVPGPVIDTVESTVIAAVLFAVPVMVKAAAVAPTPKQVAPPAQARTPADDTETVPLVAPGSTVPKLSAAVLATEIGARMTAFAFAVAVFAA